jgi:hypothetical protein
MHNYFVKVESMINVFRLSPGEFAAAEGIAPGWNPMG